MLSSLKEGKPSKPAFLKLSRYVEFNSQSSPASWELKSTFLKSCWGWEKLSCTMGVPHFGLSPWRELPHDPIGERSISLGKEKVPFPNVCQHCLCRIICSCASTKWGIACASQLPQESCAVTSLPTTLSKFESGTRWRWISAGVNLLCLLLLMTKLIFWGVSFLPIQPANSHGSRGFSLWSLMRN